jgi:uncharacterized protein
VTTETEDSTASPMAAAMLFQASLIPLALILAWLLGLPLLAQMAFTPLLLLQVIVGSAFIFACYLLLLPFGFAWAKELESKVRQMLASLFRGRSFHWALPLSILAGVGEELLFRGVIQMVLTDWLNPPIAILITAVLFGLAHAISRAYFIMATLMGLYMGLIFLWSGNLLLPILIHALYDWLAISYYLKWRRPETA